jgi:hypothetical protein
LDESKPPFGKIKTAHWENLLAALFFKKTALWRWNDCIYMYVEIGNLDYSFAA